MKPSLLALFWMALAHPALSAVKTETITYAQGGTELRGYLAYDDATGSKRPGVLVVHEWWGLNEYARERARVLAAKGYVALAVDMYGEGKTTEHPEEAGQWSSAVGDDLKKERFEAALSLLRDHELVDDARIAAIGYCFGGGTVLRLAAAGLELRGVVSFHGSLPTSAIEPGTVKAKVLVCHGADDPFTEPGQVEKFQRVFTEAGADWQFISYGGAKHSFTVKGAEKRGIPALEYNEAADRRSWAAMLSFFDEIFAPRS
jgi:dienelactone hydrolase